MSFQQHYMYASWYCCERMSKNDTEVITFAFFAHTKKYFCGFIKLKLNH